MMGLSGSLASREAGCLSLPDIAVGLSRMPRFGGQTLFRWSVAEHLLACQRYVLGAFPDGLPRMELAVLLHDAHEAMTCDITTSFKTEDVRQLQKVLDRRIYAMLGLEPLTVSMKSSVALCDRVLLLAEAYILTPPATSAQIEKELREGQHGTVGVTVDRLIDFARHAGKVAVGHVLEFRGPGDNAVAEQWQEEVERCIAKVRN